MIEGNLKALVLLEARDLLFACNISTKHDKCHHQDPKLFSSQVRDIFFEKVRNLCSLGRSYVESNSLPPLSKAMAPHSSTLAWKIPWMEEPGGLQSMGSRRIGHNWMTSLSLFTFMHWRREWQPTPVFLPGESQGRGSLVGCRLWDHTESDTTEAT